MTAIIVYARLSSAEKDFKQAEDFPREALIFAQTPDLPALIKLWSDSELRRKYIESVNFEEFRNRHLALKLVERADEIYEQIGVLPDLGFASALCADRAAFAVYDVGKMEFVFIAPMSEEKILASSIFLVQSNFEEIRLDDETTVYTKEIEVDRARQKQKILFTNFRGRLILATSEKYFLQTLENIKGKTPQNRLSEETIFKQLTGKIIPNAATVWINQEKLNEDWYFKHYWLMSDIASLKNLRSGLFDFEIQTEKLIENRVFLTREKPLSSKIELKTAQRLRQLIPEDALFSQIEGIENLDLDKTVDEILFNSANTSGDPQETNSKNEYYFRDWEKSYSYSYLDRDFSEQINEQEEFPSDEQNSPANNEFLEIIGAAKPRAILKIFSPKIAPTPLFMDDRKALVFSLQKPEELNQQKLENYLSTIAQNLFTVKNNGGDFGWKDITVANEKARELEMPSLGWKIFYAKRQNELFFSNDEKLLAATFNDGKESRNAEEFASARTINLKNRRAAFDVVFETLVIKQGISGVSTENDFFTGNIKSLLDVISNVEKIEITESSENNFRFEKISFFVENKTQ